MSVPVADDLPAASPGRAVRITANGCTWLAVLFLLFSGSLKFTSFPEVDASFVHLGLPLAMKTGLGLLELGCTFVYALRRTRLFGAVLLTGYLGGAILTHWRVGDPWVTHTLFPLWIGVLVWAGVLLRDKGLRVRGSGRAARPAGMAA